MITYPIGVLVAPLAIFMGIFHIMFIHTLYQTTPLSEFVTTTPCTRDNDTVFAMTASCHSATAIAMASPVTTAEHLHSRTDIRRIDVDAGTYGRKRTCSTTATKHIRVVTHVRSVVIMERVSLTQWTQFVAEGPSVVIKLKQIIKENAESLHHFICNRVTVLSATANTCSHACRLTIFPKIFR